MWKATVTIDSDKTDIGMASATHTDLITSEKFTYSRRIKMVAGEKAAFVSEAKAALASHATKKTRDVDLSTQLTDALNG